MNTIRSITLDLGDRFPTEDMQAHLTQANQATRGGKMSAAQKRDAVESFLQEKQVAVEGYKRYMEIRRRSGHRGNQ